MTTSERISIAGKTVTQYVYAYDWPTGIAILLIILAVLCILVLLGMSGWLFQNRLHMLVTGILKTRRASFPFLKNKSNTFPLTI